MPTYQCNNCGGRSFLADRALAGRMICTDCGTPIGQRGKIQLNRNLGKTNTLNKTWVYILIALAVILWIIAINS